MNHYVAVLIGIACAAVGGELFVRGVVGLARWARISPGIVGATMAAFATSSPELSVSVSAAVAGNPRIALGDALGSNVVNVAFIFALALAISEVHSSRDSVKRDFPVALLAPFITAILMVDGVLSRLDGALMLGVFLAWGMATLMEARRQSETAVPETVSRTQRWKTALACVGGLAFLVAAGRLIVAGARGIALSYGVDEFIIGALLVAVGTSVPELATTVIAKLRGHDEISVGTILGSNIFNGLFIVAVAALIHPIDVGVGGEMVVLAAGLMAMAAVYPSAGGCIARWRSGLLLALYAGYIGALFYLD